MRLRVVGALGEQQRGAGVGRPDPLAHLDERVVGGAERLVERGAAVVRVGGGVHHAGGCDVAMGGAADAVGDVEHTPVVGVGEGVVVLLARPDLRRGAHGDGELRGATARRAGGDFQGDGLGVGFERGDEALRRCGFGGACGCGRSGFGGRGVGGIADVAEGLRFVALRRLPGGLGVAGCVGGGVRGGVCGCFRAGCVGRRHAVVGRVGVSVAAEFRRVGLVGVDAGGRAGGDGALGTEGEARREARVGLEPPAFGVCLGAGRRILEIGVVLAGASAVEPQRGGERRGDCRRLDARLHR